jgi:hypothetical protein
MTHRDLVHPDEIDKQLDWPPGRAQRLAKRGRLPHYVLPDGGIRLRWEEVEPLVRHVPARQGGRRDNQAHA